MLYVSEIFYSLQGEGPNAGHPSVFLRTSGCNLRCTWCDTPYALERRQGNPLEDSDIIGQIRSFNCRRLVITGGEPMIQQQALRSILEPLDDFSIEVETNGGFASELDDLIDQYNCSPKLKGSGNAPYDLQLLPNEKTWYKFVIDSEADFEETQDFIREYALPQDRIRLMPQGITAEDLQKTSAFVAELCKEHGYIYNPRLHVELWGNSKGT